MLKFIISCFNLLLNTFVKIRTIPQKPKLELGINISSKEIMYIIPYNSITDLILIRTQLLINNLPDPLIPLNIDGIVLPRYIYISKYFKKENDLTLEKEFIRILNLSIELHHKNKDIDIQIIPVFIIYGRHPGHNKKNRCSLYRYIFIYIQKILKLILFGRDSFVCFSSSISLRQMIMKYINNNTVIHQLAYEVQMIFNRQLMAIVGPKLYTYKNLLNKLLTSKAILNILNEETYSKNFSYKKAKKNIISLVKEIAANFSYKMIRLTYRILSFTWNHLYQGINVYNVERVRKLAYRGHIIVYIPCHRSHMDYFLISYVLYESGLAPPHIAAGINLNFWPIGLIFRSLGAFFIRRVLKKNKLYSIIFREYLSELFRLGYSIEYFIEGGRSRTGRLLNPKTGILSITIQALLRNKDRPITLVPVYIGYEHIIEEATYIQELSGSIKAKESLMQILRSLNNLRKLGQGYVSFGEPLSLIDWLNYKVPKWDSNIYLVETTRPTWLLSVVNNIAIDLMIRINNTSVINPINLCCTALLSSYEYSLSRKQLIIQIECYINLIQNVPYSKDITIPLVNTNELIDYAVEMKKITVINKDSINEIILLPRKQLKSMYYYRNNIFHALILPSLIAAIIAKYKCLSRQELFFYIEILYPILKAELFLRWNINDLPPEINKLLNELFRQKMIFIKQNTLLINQESSYIITLKLLAGGIKESIQRYAIVFWLLSCNRFIDRISLKRKTYTIGRYLYMFNKISSLDFFDETLFNTLISILRSEGYISNTGEILMKDKIIKVYHILRQLISYDIRLVIESIRY